jgi:hypothetical protein
MELEITNFPDEILSKRILLLIEQTKENIRIARDPYYKKDTKKVPKRIILSNSAIYI